MIEMIEDGDNFPGKRGRKRNARHTNRAASMVIHYRGLDRVIIWFDVRISLEYVRRRSNFPDSICKQVERMEKGTRRTGG